MGLDLLCVFIQACDAATNGLCHDQETKDHNTCLKKSYCHQVFVIRKITKKTYSKNQSGIKRIPHHQSPLHFSDSQDQLQLIVFSTCKAT